MSEQRQRRSNQRCSRRRCRRHQLLDQRDVDELPRRRRGLVPVRASRGRLRGCVCRKQRPGRLDCGPHLALADLGCSVDPEPVLHRYRHAREQLVVHGRHAHWRAALDGDRRCSFRGQPALLPGVAEPGRGDGQDRALSARNQCPRREEPRRQAGRRCRDGALQREQHAVAQHRQPLRPEPAHQQHGRARSQGVHRRQRGIGNGLALRGDSDLRRRQHDGRLLVAGPEHRRGWRHPQARRHGSGREHPGRQYADGLPRRAGPAVQSALMTTARQNLTKEDGATPADPFDFGAGHVNPNPANDPGLVYDAGFDDYRGFLRGQGLCTFCFGTSPAPIIKASDLNLASLAIGKLAGVQTITRRLTNVGPAGTYNVSVDAPAGIDVAVDPTSLTFAAGETKTYTVTFTRTTAPFNAYSFGSLTWSDGTHSARSPIAIKSVPLAAPSEISGTGTFGSKSFSITFGYTGSFSATPQGLQAAHTETRTLTDDPTNNFDTTNPQGNQGIQLHTFTIPVGTPVARFQTFGTVNPGDDLDMYVYRVVGTTRTLVGASTGGTASEVVTLNNPTAGSYEVYIHGWEVQSGVSYTLYDWILNPAAAGNLSVSAPSSATLGASDTVTATWSGLTAATKYLGRISYSDGVSEIGGTIVRIDA